MGSVCSRAYESQISTIILDEHGRTIDIIPNHCNWDEPNWTLTPGNTHPTSWPWSSGSNSFNSSSSSPSPSSNKGCGQSNVTSYLKWLGRKDCVFELVEVWRSLFGPGLEHHTVVFMHASRECPWRPGRECFDLLKLDWASNGLSYTVETIPRARVFSVMGRLGRILGTKCNCSPRCLIKLLDKVCDRRYNIANWNCQHFSEWLFASVRDLPPRVTNVITNVTYAGTARRVSGKLLQAGAKGCIVDDDDPEVIRVRFVGYGTVTVAPDEIACE